MAAGTTETTASQLKGGDRFVTQYLATCFANDQPLYGISMPMADKATVPATAIETADDILRLSPKLPVGTHIEDFRGTPSDMDSGANFVYDVVAIAEDGTVIATLVSGSSKGQAATGSDRIADAAVGKYLGECYLALKTTTGAGAGATAGTYKWYAKFAVGLLKPAYLGIYKGDAEA
jgi:hypothetical protein